MKKIGVIITIIFLVALIGVASADILIPATPEIQGISTGTNVVAQGTVSETDALAWTTGAYMDSLGYSYAIGRANGLVPPLEPGDMQYTSGYNNAYSGISGQTTFVKSMAVSTANKIADGNNVAARTDIQYIAIDTGRATNSEDLLLDGANAGGMNTAYVILCPFASTGDYNPIPPYCNIVQAGSGFDTTLTSTVTNANDMFVGTNSAFPVVLNYNVASKGITLSDGTSSPMIGSASAFLKVHVQEAREFGREEPIGGIFGQGLTRDPKAEDLVYSETSTASGLISSFSKSMSYSSQIGSPPPTSANGG